MEERLTDGKDGFEEGIPVVDVRWSAKNAIGVREIDEDHIKLFALANDVFRAAAHGDADLRPIAMKLFSYARVHFAREEAFMVSIRYPGLDKHRRRHDRFTEMLARIMAPGTDAEEMSERLRLFMLDWIIRHILSEDRRIGEHAARAAQSAPDARLHAP